MRHLVCLAFSLLIAVPSDVCPQTADNNGLELLVLRIQEALERGDPLLYESLLADDADRAAAEIFSEAQFYPGDSRVVVQERDRQSTATESGASTRMILEIFEERGSLGRISTWRLDVRPPDQSSEGMAPWRIVDQAVLTTLDGLHRLSLNPSTQFSASNLVVSSEDLTLTLASGNVFIAEAGGRPTALVLRGRGRMVFAPRPAAEQGQLRIFSGETVLDTEFDEAFVRLPPGDLEQRVTMAALTARAVDRREFGRAEALFRDHVDLSYALDLGDLSTSLWSLLPSGGDFLADVHTRRYGTLTFARSGNQPEDITLFDRKKRRNVALYASEARLAARGPSYNEDDLEDFDVTDYLVDVAYDPERLWIDGQARLRLRVRAPSMATVTLKLAEALTVRSVVSDRFGRLMHLRVRGQDSVLISLPEVVSRDETLVLSVTYSGRLPPQPLDREALTPQDRQDPLVFRQDWDRLRPEPRYIYSTRSHWYPQGPSSNYATARIRVAVPPNYSVIASGEPDPSSPVEMEDGRLQFLFNADRPVRYLAFVASRLRRIQSTAITLPPPQGDDTGTSGDGVTIPATPSAVPERVTLVVEANPRQMNRARGLVEKLDALMGFYSAIVGAVPYPSFTLALTESDVPGGHSPAYFAVLNQPLATTPYVWQNDPASFSGFGDFYIAHEVAHQWWGQAVGWENYHEQWLSEGLSQYFAALYAERTSEPGLFPDILRQMRRWAMDRSDQGPISLGYRLGHLQSDSRIFRALVYNKGAMVLHMLRRLVGDQTFFEGIRRFYADSLFRKVGTVELRRAFEEVSGRPLERFFQRWIFEAEVPTIRFSSTVVPGSAAPTPDRDGSGTDEVLVRFEQQASEPFELAVTVTLTYQDGRVEDVVVPLTDLVVERRLRLGGPLRSVEVNGDGGALAEFVQ